MYYVKKSSACMYTHACHTMSSCYDCYFMSLYFNHDIYGHCNRENNSVAHELARIARFSPPSVWLESPRVEGGEW